jgi:hypothetical protein
VESFQVLFTTKIPKKNSIHYKSKDPRLTDIYIGKAALDKKGSPTVIKVTVEEM